MASGVRLVRVSALTAAMIFAAAGPVRALHHPDDPIDPSKRAPVSTGDAVRPAATVPTGTGVVGDGRIPIARAPVPTATVSTPKAPVVVTEAREKSVRKHGVRKTSAAPARDVKRASELPASIPRLDRRSFQKSLAEYRTGAKSARDMTHQRLRVGEKTADLAEINRFANPRATLERQGIPVVSAGSQAEPPPDSAPVPSAGAAPAPQK